MNTDLFHKVKNGEITSTNGYQVESIGKDAGDSEKYDIYISLLDMISEGYIEGVKDTKGCLGVNYKNLKVTKKGLSVYNFWKTPISKIGKPTLIEVCKNGIVGAFAGRLAWVIVVTAFVMFVPTSIREWLKSAVVSLLELIQ